MRIGILTYWQTLDNYGQVLQCYALQQLLKEMGHEPFVIRYDLYERPVFASSLRRLARMALYPVYWQRRNKRRKRRRDKALLEARRGFEAFRAEHFSFSDRVYTSLQELRRYAPPADCYIAGSDQLWGQLLSDPENEAFFLAFGGDEIRRIAFAVSYGRNEYPAELYARLQHNLRRFDDISCREREGVAICASVGVPAARVVDPTLVCPLAVYEGLRDSCARPRPYLFLYSMNITSPEDIRYDEVQLLAEKQCWRIVATVGSGYCEGQEIYPHADYSYATIGQWLSNIREAAFVVTSSFHGIVFSILFHRPFAYVPLKGSMARGNNRVLELLDDVGLREHATEGDASYEQVYRLPCDWHKVEQKLEQLRHEARAFLQKALCHDVDR